MHCVDCVRSFVHVGMGKSLDPLRGLGSASRLLRALAMRHPVLARVSFLLHPSRDSLEAALQARALSPSQKHQSRALVRPRHASRATPSLFERSPDPLGGAFSSHPPLVQFTDDGGVRSCDRTPWI